MDEKMITITIGDIDKVLTKLSRPEYKIEQPVYSWCNADVYAMLSTVLDQGFEVWKLTFYHMVLYNDQVGGREMFHIQRTIQTGPPGTEPLSFEIRIHEMYKYYDWVTPNHFIANNYGIVKITKPDADIMSILDAVRPKADIDSGKLSSILSILMQIADEQDTVKEEISDMDVTFKELFSAIERNKTFNKMTKQSSCGSYSTYITKGVDAMIIDIADDTTEEDGNVEIPMSIKYQGRDIIISAYGMTNSGNKIRHMHVFECDHTKSVCEALEFVLSEDVGNKCISSFDNMKKAILNLAI